MISDDFRVNINVNQYHAISNDVRIRCRVNINAATIYHLINARQWLESKSI